MTIYINDETIERVKDSCDIVDVISDYIQLKRTGTNHVGLCPFHNEKTPSFTVNQSKQFFHCFGCGESGDSIAFIMKKENLDFPQAVKLLADKLGIDTVEVRVNDKYTQERQEAYNINKDAARYFYRSLVTNPKALEYLNKRQISANTIRGFGLGFAPESWEGLYRFLLSKGYGSEQIEKIGLIGKKSGNNGYYDKFRNRIMFPIIDTKSRIIGFGGRVLDDKMPKYLNSKESIIFNKGNHLYGLNLVNKHSNRKRILLVEGYIDVISLYSKGINYAVASLGTALTERQGRLLKRYGDEVYIAYDSDTAGVKATLKAIDILLKEDVKPKIILLPDGMDPDDYINKMGKIEFEKLFLNSYNHIDYKILINKKKYDLNDIEDKIKFTTEVSKIIKDLKSPVEQDVYINKISEDTGVSKEAIEKEIKGNKIYNTSVGNSRKFRDNKQIISPIKSEITSGYIRAETDLIKLMIDDRDYYEFISKRLSREDFSSKEYRILYDLISEQYENNSVLEIKKVIEATKEKGFKEDFIKSLVDTKLKYKPTNIDQILTDLINTVIINKLERLRREIIKNIEDLEKLEERTKEQNNSFRKLFLELTDLNNQIKTIKQE
ncbi:DNA primase [Lachnospiraceae bacterium NSJ-29]|uniref:DNA primase n=2 Tax=Wansuia hejianensis TaxID=2763667 RepID=A0A926F2L0_9FIRM|nr:DNA primase [Wansuia hejianensis]